MALLTLKNWHADDSGAPRAGATVTYKLASESEPNTNPVLGTTTTNASGRWLFSGVAPGVYDAYLVDGVTVKFWKGLASLPLSFGDAQVDAAADIQLTKINYGTRSEAATPGAGVTSLDDTINQILSQLKIILAGAHWYTAPVQTITSIAADIASFWAKFSSTTGHAHSGAALDGAQVSHANLGAVGTLTHANLDVKFDVSSGHKHTGAAADGGSMFGGTAPEAVGDTSAAGALTLPPRLDHVHGRHPKSVHYVATDAAKIQYGSFSVTVLAGQLNGDASVAFPTAYAGTPIVIAGLGALNGASMGGCWVDSVSNTAFRGNVRILATSGVNQAFTIYWWSVGT